MVFDIKLSHKLEINKNKKYFYFYCPDCGKDFKVERNNLYTRKTNKCISCSSLIGLKKVNVKPLHQAIYTKLINSAKKKNIFCSLSFKEFLKFTKIKRCTYCKSEIEWSSSSDRYNLDRMINEKGYVFTNLTVCCWNCNNTKSNRFSHEEFIMLSKGLQKIQKYRLQQKGG